VLGGGWVWADAAGKNAVSLAIAACVGGCPRTGSKTFLGLGSVVSDSLFHESRDFV